MGFIINQNFDLKSPQFNFARDYYTSFADLKTACGGDWSNYSSFPNHFITNVNGTLYQYTSTNDSTPNTGKWRSYKPAEAKKADLATKADSAAQANSANSAINAAASVRATNDGEGNNIVNTYATKTELDTKANKSDISALTSALVYKGTIGTDGTITTTDVPAKVGDVYVAIAGAPSVNSVALEAGDMIIAKTAGDGTTTHATWTAVQTNINGAVTTTDTLTESKLIVGGGNRTIKTATGTGFVKMLNGVVSTDNSTYATTTALSNKVDKVDGKGLSTNDFTAAYKNKLDDLGLSGDSFNNALTNTKGLRLNLVGTTSSYDIPIVKASTDASTYGLMSGTDKDKLDKLQNYTLKAANTDRLGGIKIGFAKDDTNKNYPVQLSGDKAYVHVPWVDNNTTYPLASESVNGLMSSSDKAKLSRIQYPTSVLTSQLDLCGFEDYATLVNAVANQKDGLSFWVGDQNAIVTLQTDNGKHAIIQTIRTATELNNSWEFAAGATSSHKDGALFTYQRFYPIGGTYSTNTHNKWTKWAIIDVDTMYTDGRTNMNTIYKAKGKQLLSNLTVDKNGKITFSSVYSGIDATGIKSESNDILTPIPESEITKLFN